MRRPRKPPRPGSPSALRALLSGRAYDAEEEGGEGEAVKVLALPLPSSDGRILDVAVRSSCFVAPPNSRPLELRQAEAACSVNIYTPQTIKKLYPDAPAR